MDNLPLSQLITPAAKAARADLLSALGTENNPAQWMHFMSTVREHLPAVLSRGRPSQDAIAHSVVGQHGFTSWRQMIEAPTDQYGLGWSWSAWRQWSRAWRTVEDHPFLKSEPLTAAQVNRLAESLKSAGAEWPEDPERLDELQQQLDTEKAENREQGRAAQAARIEELEKEVEHLKAQYRQKIGQSRQLVRKAQGERDEARRSLQQALEKRRQPRPQLTRWQHFLAALGLG